MRLKDKVAIVVGGANGIGRATSLTLARQGARCVIADLDIERANTAAEEIKIQGGNALAIQLDMTNCDETARMVDTTLAKYGRIDILANVAGGSTGKYTREMSKPFCESIKEEWDRIININLTGPRNCTRAVINHMIERRYGKIINFSSIFGMIGSPNSCDYAAAKAGIIGFTKSLAAEVSCYGINVNCIAPGVIATEMAKDSLELFGKDWVKAIPISRYGTVQEVADLILFLSSNEADYITGATIDINGGLYMR